MRFRTQTSTGQASSTMLVASMESSVEASTGLLERWRVEPSVRSMSAPVVAKTVRSLSVMFTSEALNTKPSAHPDTSKRSMRSNF